MTALDETIIPLVIKTDNNLLEKIELHADCRSKYWIESEIEWVIRVLRSILWVVSLILVRYILVVDSTKAEVDTDMRIFGKGELNGHRRLGVLLARAENVEQALAKVERMAKNIKIEL